jgi:hypothetical protein
MSYLKNAIKNVPLIQIIALFVVSNISASVNAYDTVTEKESLPVGFYTISSDRIFTC